MLCNGIYRDAGRTMTKGAASVEMGGAKPDHVRIVEFRNFNTARVPLDGVPHAEVEETLDERPVTLARGDVPEAGPGKSKRAQDSRRRNAQ
jgi:hypothetical protein